MSRLPYAAKQLISQVAAHNQEAEVTEGAPDGFGVVRTVSFDKKTSRWLWPLLKNQLDPRLANAQNKRGQVTLTFQSSSPLADDRSTWPQLPPAGLPTALEHGQGAEQETEQETEQEQEDEPDAEVLD